MGCLTVTLAPDRQTVRLTQDRWTGVFPTTQIPSLIRLYTALRYRKQGRYARHYTDSVCALIKFQKAMEKGPTDAIR